MDIDIQSLMNTVIKVQEACRIINQYKDSIDESMRRKELRDGSIDVEFRIIEQ